MNAHASIDHVTERSFRLSFGVLASGILTSALGLLALVGWVLGLPLPANFGVDLIPMAPSTAVLFVLYGTAVCLRARLPLTRRAFRMSVTAGCLGALVALLLFTLGCLHMQWPVESLGLNTTRTVGGAPIGHMSPVTAFCFLVASVSFLISLSLSATRAWRTALAFGSAGLLLGTCFVFLLAYLYGAPLLYSGRFIPPALNTILAFAMLSLALLTLAGRPAGLFDGSLTEGSRTAFPLVLIFVLLAAGIVAIGNIYFRHYEKHYRAEAEHQLSAIAELKVGELVQWRRDRLQDTAIFFKNPSFSALVRRFFEKPSDEDAQRQLMDWLGKYPTVEDCDQVRLMDAQGVTRLSAPAGLKPASSDTVRAAAKVLRSGQVAIKDFHRHEDNQRVYLAVLMPILGEQKASPPLGVLVLRLDPTTYLYPFIQRWPTPSQSAETLLVRREGNEAVFLNELRFQTNTALSLRVPLEKTEFSAVKAVLGQTGIVEGQDYCGCPTIADVRAVPDSPWFLVARMDTAEVDAPLRERLWLTVVLAGVLLIGAGAGAGLLSRQQRLQFYRERAQAAEALRASENRFRSLFDSSRDAVMTLEPPAWKFTSGNPATVAMFGARNAENFVTFGPWELSPEQQPDGRASVEKAREMIETAMREGSHFFEWTHQRITGQVFPATVLLSRMETSGKVFLQATVRDITEHQQAEAALRQSEARYRAVADSANDAIITADEFGNVVGWNQGAERIFGYAGAEILGQPLTRLIPHGYRDPGAEGMHRAEAGGVPPVISKTVESEGMRKDGSAFPLELSLADWQTDAGRFYTRIIRDITERKRTEDKLRQLSRAVEQSPVSIVITDPAGDIEYANPKFGEVTGYTLAEVLGKNPRFLKSGDLGPEGYRQLWQTITGGKEWRGEFHNKKKNGELYWESASLSPIRDLAGRITHYVAVKEDITARKQTEAERVQLIQELQAALTNVKSLSGLLPICAGCKQIRDDKGYWSQVESYIQRHSEATFTHGLCPDCIKKYYPELGDVLPGDSHQEAL
jgi:PAS domain S-box-containing protein